MVACQCRRLRMAGSSDVELTALMNLLLLPPIAAADVAGPVLPWAILIAIGAVAAAVGLLVLWWLFGLGPRRARGYRRSQRLVRQGDWAPALDIVRKLQAAGRLSFFWEGRLRNAEGECERTAGVLAVQAGEFEKGLEHHVRAAELLGINSGEVRASIVEKMLAEVRARFSAAAGENTTAVHALLGRVLAIESACAEALFWQGLCRIRERQWELAQGALQASRDADAQPGGKTQEAGVGSVDAPLYLGGVLLRLGQAKEGLRIISEANRLGGNCPLVALHLGLAMVAAGTDGNLAIRALNRAVGSGGLPKWFEEPDKAWKDGLPESHSFVRKLAVEHRFVCPLWGNDLRALVRQGKLALGQAHFRLQQYLAAADVFQNLLDESAPTHDVLRWLGLAQTRLERYQDAFRHLKTALELENPKDRMTAGYLAMCAACAKPDHPEDKAPNVTWAVRTVRQYEGLGDREWVGILMQVFGEALKLNLALSGDDQVFLCDHLLSVQATDRAAAGAYHQLAVDHPALLKPPFAWLYCRAAMEHPVDHVKSLDLFARTFESAADARTYFAGHKWDFAELEFIYLKQKAIQSPGAFPAVLGADYPARGEALLLERSQRLERENQGEAALACADVLLRLAPHSPRAHDHLAGLWYRRGKLDRASELLSNWCAFEPKNPLPWARLAVIQEKQGLVQECLQSIDTAIEHSDGRARADLHCLAARLLLSAPAEDGHKPEVQVQVSTTSGITSLALQACNSLQLQKAKEHLRQCLDAEPGHTTALWLLAALRAVQGDGHALAAQAAAMDGKESTDARFNYFVAVSQLAAGSYVKVQEAAAKAGTDAVLQVEAAYLAGWACMHQHDTAGAISALRCVARTEKSASCAYARAVLGGIYFQQGATDEAIEWWQSVDAERRTFWGLDEPLQKSLFLAGLNAIQKGDFERAADRFREAGKSGLRERTLGGLIQFALVKAGQRLLYGKEHG